MSEKRMIYADDIVKVADHAYDQWNLAMAAADGQREINLCFKRQDLCKAVAAVAKNAPTIDPETLPIVRELRAKLAECEPVVHAHWEWVADLERPGIRTLSCSHCRGKRWAHEEHKYCPHCGAKMDEDTEE